jgi:hypothetical protein
MDFEYRVVPAPKRLKRVRGASQRGALRPDAHRGDQRRGAPGLGIRRLGDLHRRGGAGLFRRSPSWSRRPCWCSAATAAGRASPRCPTRWCPSRRCTRREPRSAEPRAEPGRSRRYRPGRGEPRAGCGPEPRAQAGAAAERPRTPSRRYAGGRPARAGAERRGRRAGAVAAAPGAALPARRAELSLSPGCPRGRGRGHAPASRAPRRARRAPAGCARRGSAGRGRPARITTLKWVSPPSRQPAWPRCARSRRSPRAGPARRPPRA